MKTRNRNHDFSAFQRLENVKTSSNQDMKTLSGTGKWKQKLKMDDNDRKETQYGIEKLKLETGTPDQ